MKRNKRILILSGIMVYLLLLMALIHFERAYLVTAPKSVSASGITSVFQAVWYSLTTLTTVGYGDIYPHSFGGQLIGMLFMLGSVGVLAFFFSVLLTSLRTRFLPCIALFLARKDPWYLFDAYTPEGEVLAQRLRRDAPGCQCVYVEADAERCGRTRAGRRVFFTLEELLKIKGKHRNVKIFCISGRGMENYALAKKLVQAGGEVCCLSEYEPERILPGLSVFDPFRCCARQYWSLYPLRSPDERVVLIGSGRYANALLEQALSVNIIARGQHVCYWVYGGAMAFEEQHPWLSDGVSVNQIDPRRDSIVFRRDLWKDLDVLREADRVILCEDDLSVTMELYCRIKMLCPLTGRLYARIPNDMEGVTAFGGMEQVFTPELVLHQHLDRVAVQLNEYYRSLYGGPVWEALDSFKRHSNFAAADHLEVKVRILLGDTHKGEPESRRRQAAWKVYQSVRETWKDELRWIEHERWMRFHLVNNWRYAPVRDNLRRFHELLLPYEDLSPEEQAKDDGGWELLSLPVD